MYHFSLEGVRTTRQYLRLLGFLSIIKELSSDSKTQNEGVFARVLKRLSSFLYSVFIILDNIAVLSKHRFLKLNPATIHTLAHLAWLLGTICSALYHSAVLLALLVKEEHLRLRFLQHSNSIVVSDPA